jgi:hypothetical protein
VFEWNVESDEFTGLSYSFPDFFARNPKIFTTESNVIADTFQDDLVFGILQHETNLTSGLGWRLAINEHTSVLSSLVLTEDTCKCTQKCALAYPRCPQHEDSFPRTDVEGDIAQRRGGAGSELPAPSLC